jgi:hypothetical protein
MANKAKRPGETMTYHIVKTTARRYARRHSWLTEAVQDALMVSSFGLWAMLLGFAPVVTLRMLIGG